jgi:peptidoglycan/xylan/chitin deacetylase (PgdA/CDA1 family)
MGLAGINRVVGPMFSAEDVRAAHYAGHEIACHTFSHPDCRELKGSAIQDEIRDNATAVRSVVADRSLVNFAYPYGAVSPTAKRTFGVRFRTCRGICPGINYRFVDLADLKAIALYDASFCENEMRRLVDHNQSVGGWLIFYTHDVVDTPSPFGCTPRELETVVNYAARRTTILPIRDVAVCLRPLRPKL